MKKYKTIMVESQELETVVCNQCGRAIYVKKGGNADHHVNVVKTWGYGTDWDGEKHEFDLCPDCYRILISQFKIDVNRKTGCYFDNK
ncbi:MAG: hypothetical protein LBC41_02835 [Clostridiales bacterium]|nr:hypothetical protein [Clostridiales bacterium]